MKLRYRLIPMERAVVFQVLEHHIKPHEFCYHTLDHFCLRTADYKLQLEKGGIAFRFQKERDIASMEFDSNNERDEWIAAAHKSIAEWAKNNELALPDVVWEAEEIIRDAIHDYLPFNCPLSMKGERWLTKYAHPIPHTLGDYTWEV